MITDVAELLVALSQAEAAKLAKSDITHAPTIGAMYEGLTRDILDRAVPPELGLQVVDGFVVDGQGGRSGQIDGMLVRGQGVPVPFTGQFEWQVKDVLAVFEVKKTLTAANLADAYDQTVVTNRTHAQWGAGSCCRTIDRRLSTAAFRRKPKVGLWRIIAVMSGQFTK